MRFELVNRIHARGERVEVWLGRGEPLRAGSAFAMIAPALRRAAGIRDDESLDVQRQKQRARVARHATIGVHRMTLFIGELVGVNFGEEPDAVLRAARADPILMADQLRRAFEHFLAIETVAQPVVLLLEDLHWGDLPSVKLIESALRALPDRPWLVVAVARPDVHDLFPRLWVDRGVHEVRLDELTRKAAEKLVRRVLGDDASPALVGRILDRAGGNPFYLEELIRAVVDGKGDALPETVLAVVQGRLERLEGDARRVLRAASVFGQAFWRGGVIALLGGEAREDTVRVWIDELAQRELVVRAPAPRFPDEDEYLFRSSLVREAAYAMLTDSDRRLGHALAASWLERVGEGDAMVLAEHRERGGDRAAAVGWYLKAAAARAVAAGDFTGAIARADRGSACGTSGEGRGRLRGAGNPGEDPGCLGGASAVPADPDRGAEVVGGVRRRRAPWPRRRWRCCRRAARAGTTPRRRPQRRSGARATRRRARRVIGEAMLAAPEDVRSVTATAHSAFQLFYSGHLELAQALLDRVERVADAVVDPAVLARVYQARSSRASFTGDAGAYLETEQTAAELFERAGDLRNACMQRGHVGYACLEIGAYAEAEHWLRGALAVGEQMGLSSVVATAKHNLGRALWHQARYDEGAIRRARGAATRSRRRATAGSKNAARHLHDVHLRRPAATSPRASRSCASRSPAPTR